MKHQHSHKGTTHGQKILWVTFLNLSITIVQIIGGIFSNSLSLLSDAMHNLGDSSALFIAFVAGKIGRKKPDEHNTFGYKRAEILAALFNSVVLIAICIVLVVQAVQRFIHPEFVRGELMFVVALFGLFANLLSVLILNRNQGHSLNLKAAYLHLLGDTLSSVAVIVGSVAIWHLGIIWVDPLVTLLVAVYIIYHTWSVLKETVDILMQSTPPEIKLNELKKEVEQFDEVENIHHVHVWRLADNQKYLEAHLNLKNNLSMVDMMRVKQQVEDLLHHSFGISHVTLQTGFNCCVDHSDLIYQKHELMNS
jgi:cobalt-zinc-cadmium efflux system protein